jgi:hypothetical protein
MPWDLIWPAFAVVCAALAFMLFRWLYQENARHHPLILHLTEHARSRDHHEFALNIAADGNRNITLGKIGELITSLMHAADGWQQIPSQPNGIHGLAGIFVRRLANSKAFEVRFVETAASSAGDGPGRFDNQRMNDVKIDEALNQLAEHKASDDAPYISAVDTKTLRLALKHGSLYVSKLHYHHNLASGRTQIYRIRSDGSLTLNAKSTAVVESLEHKFMLQSLAIGLGRLEVVGFKVDDDRRVSLSSGPGPVHFDVAA